MAKGILNGLSSEWREFMVVGSKETGFSPLVFVIFMNDIGKDTTRESGRAIFTVDQSYEW